MTTPIAEPANATSGKDFDPTSSSCRISSRHSKGGVTAALSTFHEKTPRLPNHSKKPLLSLVAEMATADMAPIRGSGCEGSRATAVNSGELTAAGLSLERRANGSDASVKTRFGVPCKGTPRLYSCRQIQADCSCPCGVHP